MTNEIVYRDPRGTTGLTVYVHRFTATWAVWNGTAHVAFNPANWPTYKIHLADQGGGYYAASMPPAPAGLYYFVAYQQVAGAPAPTDPTLNSEATPMQWDGTAEVPLSAVPAAVWLNGSRTLTAFGFSVVASNAPPNWSSLAISTGGLVAIDTGKPIPTRNQDSVDAPTIADALQGAWENNYGAEAESDSAGTWVKQLPDKSGPSRSFTLVLDTNGVPVGRS